MHDQSTMPENTEKKKIPFSSAWKKLTHTQDHRNGQRPESAPAQGLPESPRPRRGSLSLSRQATRQNTLLVEDDQLEKNRKELRALERGLSLENVNGRHPDESRPPPPPHDPERNMIARQPTNVLPTQTSVTPLLDISLTTEPLYSTSSQPPPVDGTYNSNPEEQYINTDSVEGLREQLEITIANHNKLQEEYSKERAEAAKFCNAYHRVIAEKKALDASKSTLDHELLLARKQISDNQQYIASVTAMKETHQAAIEEKNSQYYTLRQEMDKLQVSYSHVAADAQRLGLDNARLNEDLLKGRETFNAVNGELLQLKSELRNNIDDQSFIRQWNDLHAKIENLSNQYFRGRISKPKATILKQNMDSSSSKKLPPPPSRRLTDVDLTKDHAQYINSEEFRPFIIQAFIWWSLVIKVFDHCKRRSNALYWAGGARNSLSNLIAELRPKQPRNLPHSDPHEIRNYENKAKSFHKWRSTTAMMLLSEVPANERLEGHELMNLLDDIMEVLSNYITAKDIQRPQAEKNINASLGDIVATAIALDADMQQQRAWIYCEQWSDLSDHAHPFWGFHYEPEEMHGIYGPAKPRSGRDFKEPVVDLVLKPALYREGNELGGEYAIRRLLCKGKVVVVENSMLTPSRRR